jgi:hypothetical protein
MFVILCLNKNVNIELTQLLTGLVYIDSVVNLLFETTLFGNLS